jgi:hypothetical protein
MRPYGPAHPTDVSTPEPSQARTRRRDEIPERFKWNLADIFPDWPSWEDAYNRLDRGIERYAALKGTLAGGPGKLLEAFTLSEELGQLAYRVWYFPSLQYDQDQRDNGVNAKRQQVQILFARWKQAESWFNPEVLQVPLETVRRWMDEFEPLRLYRFAIEDLYRQQEHVLDDKGERLMSLASRLAAAPNDAYWALSTADASSRRSRCPPGAGDGLVRPVPRDPGDAARAGGPRESLPRAARDVSGVAQHLRRPVQRRLPARLVPGARARLP